MIEADDFVDSLLFGAQIGCLCLSFGSRGSGYTWRRGRRDEIE